MNNILTYSASKIQEFSSIDLAQCIYKLAKIKQICGGLEELDQQQLDKFYQSWFHVATVRLADFNAQDLANSLWAVAKLNYHDLDFCII